MFLHASCIAIAGQGILLSGPPGSGKSDLALRLIDRGAVLVADDQIMLQRDGDILFAAAPETTAGMIEIRHVGLYRMPFRPSAEVKLIVELTGLDENLERLPADNFVFLLDLPIRRLRLPAFAASTPAKIRAALSLTEIA